MSPHELAKYWDPNLKDPETFRSWSGPGYIKNLSANIKTHGLKNPIQLTNKGHTTNTYIYDGHHRILAGMDLGKKTLPYRVVSGKPGEQ